MRKFILIPVEVSNIAGRIPNNVDPNLLRLIWRLITVDNQADLGLQFMKKKKKKKNAENFIFLR